MPPVPGFGGVNTLENTFSNQRAMSFPSQHGHGASVLAAAADGMPCGPSQTAPPMDPMMQHLQLMSPGTAMNPMLQQLMQVQLMQSMGAAGIGMMGRPPMPQGQMSYGPLPCAAFQQPVPMGPPTLLPEHARCEASVVSGQVIQTKDPMEVEAEQLRRTNAAFRSLSKPICNSYTYMGAAWYHGNKVTVTKKPKQIAIQYIHPRVWNALRINLLSEVQIDMLTFVLFGVVPQVLVKGLNVKTQFDLMDMLLQEHSRIKSENPQRLAKLCGDLTNIKAVAIEYGYPKQYLPPDSNPTGEPTFTPKSTRSGFTPNSDVPAADMGAGRKQIQLAACVVGSSVQIEEVEDSEGVSAGTLPPKRASSFSSFDGIAKRRKVTVRPPVLPSAASDGDDDDEEFWISMAKASGQAAENCLANDATPAGPATPNTSAPSPMASEKFNGSVTSPSPSERQEQADALRQEDNGLKL